MSIKKPKLLLISCDSYKSIAEITISQLKKYGVNDYFDCAVSLTNDKLSDINGFKVLLSRSSKGWSAELYEVLNQIDDEYVFIWLDDFVPTTRPPFEQIQKLLLRSIEQKVSYARLIPTPKPTGAYCQYLDLYEIEQSQIYRTSIRFCLWKIQTLKSILNKDENAWQFEYNSPSRAKLIPGFYSSNKYFFEFVNLIVKGKVDTRVVDKLNKAEVKIDSLMWKRMSIIDVSALTMIEFRSYVFNLLPLKWQNYVKHIINRI